MRLVRGRSGPVHCKCVLVRLRGTYHENADFDMSELPEAPVAPTEPEAPVALADIEPARISDAEEEQYGSSTGRRRRKKRVSVPTVDGAETGPPAAAKMPSLAENTPVAPSQQESTTEENLKIGLRNKSVRAAHSLRHGTFRITETNKLLNFVYVPDDFDPESGDVVGEALAALGLTKPDIAFYFHKGGKLAEQRVVDQRVSAVMDGISAACAQTHSMYMLRQPYEGNRLAEIVCKSAAQAGDDCPILGLFHLGNLTRIDESRDADVRDEAFFEKLRDFTEYEEGMKKNTEAAKAGEPEVDLGPAPEDPWKSVGYGENGEAGLPIYRKWDAQRVLVGDTVNHRVNLAATASSLKEVGTTIDVSCRQTEVEKAMAEATGNGITGLAMIDRVTHAIVFGDPDFPLLNKGKGPAEYQKAEGEVLPDLTMSSPTQKAFSNSVVEQLPTGIISAGGSKPLFDSCIECLRLGRPVFCFRGTGGSTETIAKLIDFGNLKKGRNGKPGATQKQLENFIAREFTAEKKLLYWREAKALACNFPEHFNPSAALVIEVGAPEGHKFSLTNFSPEAGDSVDRLQDQITKVMASVFDNVPELGGVEADARSVRHALALQSNLLWGATRYRREGSIIVTITRVLGFGTSIAAALRADSESDIKDEMWLKWLAMALPLLLGVSASVMTTYRPIQKFAALKTAASEIESEIYRFRTRSRPYYASKSTTSGKGHRQLFSSTCDRILATHMTGDAALSAERLVNADQWLPKVVASVAPAAERGGTIAALPVLATDAKPEVEMSLHDGTSPASGDVSASAWPPKSDATSTLGADAYTRERALPALKKAQQQAPRISRQLKALQLLVIIGAAVRAPPPSTLPCLCPALPCASVCLHVHVPHVTLSDPRRTLPRRGSRLPRLSRR